MSCCFQLYRGLWGWIKWSTPFEDHGLLAYFKSNTTALHCTALHCFFPFHLPLKESALCGQHKRPLPLSLSLLLVSVFQKHCSVDCELSCTKLPKRKGEKH